MIPASIPIPLSGRGSVPIRYGAAVVLAALAQAARLPIHPPTLMPFITYAPLLILAAALGGLGPGLVCTVLCALECAYFALEPVGSLTVSDPQHWLGIAFLASVGVVASVLMERIKRAERSLFSANQELTAIQANVPLTLLVVDENLIVRDVSETGQATRQGVAPKELRPGPAIGCLNALADERGCGHSPSCQKCPLRVTLLDTLRDGTRHTGIEGWFPAASPDGGRTRRCFQISTSPLRIDAKPKVLLCVQDITERKLTEQALAKSEASLARAQSMAHLGSWESDLITREVRWSKEVYRIFGLSPNSIRPTRDEFFARVHPDDLDAVRQAFDRAVNAGGVYSVDHRILLPNNVIRVVHELGEVVRDSTGRPRTLIGTVQDITEQKQVETELRDSNEFLEQFAYAVSHDLQEPLRMVNAYVGLLNRHCAECLHVPPEVFSYITEGAERMNAMIDGLLEYSRVNRPNSSLNDPVDLSQAVTWAKQNLRMAISESGASIACEDLPEVNGDFGQLAMVFQNLIGNAIKYRGTDAPHISISARQGRQEWLISVKDNGIGIDPKYHDRIFGLFRRLHSRAKIQGTGIGLTISRRIIERHGGRMWVSSQAGEGATFAFTLPDQELASVETPVSSFESALSG